MRAVMRVVRIRVVLRVGMMGARGRLGGGRIVDMEMGMIMDVCMGKGREERGVRMRMRRCRSQRMEAQRSRVEWFGSCGMIMELRLGLIACKRSARKGISVQGAGSSWLHFGVDKLHGTRLGTFRFPRVHVSRDWA